MLSLLFNPNILANAPDVPTLHLAIICANLPPFDSTKKASNSATPPLTKLLLIMYGHMEPLPSGSAPILIWYSLYCLILTPSFALKESLKQWSEFIIISAALLVSFIPSSFTDSIGIPEKSE